MEVTFITGAGIVRQESIVKIEVSAPDAKIHQNVMERVKKAMEMSLLKKAPPALYHSGGIVGRAGTILATDEMDDEMTISLHMGEPEPEPEPTDLAVYEENDAFGAF